jgi:hypothetical protein
MTMRCRPSITLGSMCISARADAVSLPSETILGAVVRASTAPAPSILRTGNAGQQSSGAGSLAPTKELATRTTSFTMLASAGDCYVSSARYRPALSGWSLYTRPSPRLPCSSSPSNLSLNAAASCQSAPKRTAPAASPPRFHPAPTAISPPLHPLPTAYAARPPSARPPSATCPPAGPATTPSACESAGEPQRRTHRTAIVYTVPCTSVHNTSTQTWLQGPSPYTELCTQ